MQRVDSRFKVKMCVCATPSFRQGAHCMCKQVLVITPLKGERDKYIASKCSHSLLHDIISDYSPTQLSTNEDSTSIEDTDVQNV